MIHVTKDLKTRDELDLIDMENWKTSKLLSCL